MLGIAESLTELEPGVIVEDFTDNFDFYDREHLTSAHTGDEFRGETLYYTAAGKWILEHWSRWQDEREWYEYITDEQAWEWLVENGENEAVVSRLFG